MAMSITAAEVASRLGGARSGSEGWYCRCPAHDDKKASLWIKDRDGGGLIVKCHAGCAKENVEERLRSTHLWPETGRAKRDDKDFKKRVREGEEIDRIIVPVPTDAPEIEWKKIGREPPTQLYAYRNSNDELTGYVARWDALIGDKDIRPVSFARLKDGRNLWVMRAPPPTHDLYNLPEVIARLDAPVIVVEGEKAADAAKRLFPDHVAVTWRSGASAAEKTDFHPLQGRDVILWPDADDPGHQAMETVAHILTSAGAKGVRLVTLPAGLPKGWDVADPPPPGMSVTATLKELTAAAESDNKAAEEKSTPANTAPAQQESQGLRPFVISADALMQIELPVRELIVDPFLATSSLTMIYGARGGGKTWVGLTLATSVASGENFLAYKVDRPRTVLLIDGEMAFAEIQARIRALNPAPSSNFLVLPSELLFRESRPINLHDPGDQEEIEVLLAALVQEGREPDLLILDNLSSLSGGVDENDNSALDHLLRWLIKLRHTGLAVVLIHHAGKNGSQRGASRREDLLDTSISLVPPAEDATPHNGAHLVLRFAKTRGLKPNPEELELRLSQNRDRLEWQFSKPMQIDRATELLRMIWERRPSTQAELAAHAGVKEAAISHQVKKLRLAGHLCDGTPPTLTSTGREHLLQIWPELESMMVQQGELALRHVL